MAQAHNGNAELVHIGFGNFLDTNKVVVLANMSKGGPAPIQRLVRDAKRKATTRIIDVTSGRRTKTAAFIDNGDIVLVAITPEAIHGRVTGKPGRDSQDEESL